MNAVTLKTVAGAIKYQAVKHAPEIFVGTGITGMCVGAVLACKASTNSQSIIDELKAGMAQIEECKKLCAEQNDDRYTPQLELQDKIHHYTNAGVKFVKLYAPSVSIFTIGIGCILYGTGILKARNLGLAMGLEGMTNLYAKYRSNVINELGKDADNRFRYGLKEVSNVDVREDKSDTTEVKTKKKATAVDTKITTMNPYSRWFSADNANWRKDAGMNRTFLMGQQNYANDKLKVQGHLFLNEVLKACGFKPTAIGAQVGWIYNPEDDTRDNFVDFGFMPTIDGLVSVGDNDFYDSKEYDIHLDFNVDGPILNDIDNHALIGAM